MTAAVLELPVTSPGGRTLRPYQHEAGTAVIEDWAAGVARTVVLLPTGCGKTDVIAALAVAEVLAGGRVLCLAHRTELLDQITERIAQHDPSIRVGRIQASRDERHFPITVAMIQTLAGRHRATGEYRRLARLPQPTLVIVDECHHAISAGYLAVLRGLGCYGADAMRLVPGLERRAPVAEPVRTLGVTATLTRGDGGPLGDVWSSVAFARDTAWAVDQGYLVRPRGRVVVADHLRLDRAKVRRGDYTDSELGKMITQSAAQIVADWIEHGRHPDGTPRTTAAFCPDITSANALAAEFAAAGVPVGLVTGATRNDERRRLYRDLAAGRIMVLVSIMVLTEGWDCPRVSCILQCRPTKLPGLYTQIVGRGLRPWDLLEAIARGWATADSPEKIDCLVLDVVGATRGQKLTTLVDLHESAEYDTSELDEALACETCGNEPCTCADARDELDESDGWDGDESPPVPDVAGAPKEYAEIELLAAESDWTWLRTYAGHPFLPVGDRFVCVYAALPSGPARFSVGWVTSPNADRPAPGQGTAWLGHALTAGEARDLAERWASFEPGANLAQRAARWRRGRPTDGQLRYARGLGVVDPERLDKSGLSDAISVALASAVIDR